jgi:hypothetical protein
MQTASQAHTDAKISKIHSFPLEIEMPIVCIGSIHAHRVSIKLHLDRDIRHAQGWLEYHVRAEHFSGSNATGKP